MPVLYRESAVPKG